MGPTRHAHILHGEEGIPELDMCGKTLLAEDPITIPPETVATGPAILQSKITANARFKWR
jgi:hypothetical protein